MNAYELPESLAVDGVEHAIRTDFRAVLDVLKYCSDPEYEEDEKALIMLRIMFIDWPEIPPERYNEAIEKVVEFIDMGIKSDNACAPTLMDWEQDAPLILPAVNRLFQSDVRAMPHLHWWTFLGAYMEIGESLFSTVLHIRQKKLKGKLEKHEREFLQQNRLIVELRRKESSEQREEKDELIKLLDGDK